MIHKKKFAIIDCDIFYGAIMSSVLFHLAFPVRDIPTTKAYYVDGLGCGLGEKMINRQS